MAETQVWQDQNKHVIVSKQQEQLIQTNIFILTIKDMFQIHVYMNA